MVNQISNLNLFFITVNLVDLTCAGSVVCIEPRLWIIELEQWFISVKWKKDISVQITDVIWWIAITSSFQKPIVSAICGNMEWAIWYRDGTVIVVTLMLVTHVLFDMVIHLSKILIRAMYNSDISFYQIRLTEKLGRILWSINNLTIKMLYLFMRKWSIGYLNKLEI